MAWRSLAFVLGTFVLGGFAFSWLVARDLERVVSVHAIDKATHLVDMLEVGADDIEALHNGVAMGAFLEMARASQVASVYLYDLEGNKQARRSTWAEGDVAGDAHAAHAHHGAMDHQGENSQHAHLSAGHAHHTDPKTLSRLADTPKPRATELGGLISGTRDSFFSLSTLESDHQERVHYAQIVLPAFGPNAELCECRMNSPQKCRSKNPQFAC
jgi:hypothetical protein